jgi:hypothetical protein
LRKGFRPAGGVAPVSDSTFFYGEEIGRTPRDGTPDQLMLIAAYTDNCLDADEMESINNYLSSRSGQNSEHRASTFDISLH